MAPLFDIALRAWPRQERERDGEMVADTAAQLVEEGRSSRSVELLSIVRSGLALRFRRRRVASAPWTEAAALLIAPLLAILLIGVLSQIVLTVPGYPYRFLSPGFSTTLLAGLLFLTLAATLLSRRNLALLSSLAALLILTGRIYRIESLGSPPGVMPFLGFDSGFGINLSVDMDPALLPPLLLAVICCLLLRGSRRPIRLRPVGLVVALGLAAFAVAWFATNAGATWSGDMMPGQAPVMFLLWLAPILFFLAVFIGRFDRPVRLAASLGLTLAGPATAWMFTGLPAFYDWPDAGVMLLMLGMQLFWIGLMLAGIRSSTSPPGRPAPS